MPLLFGFALLACAAAFDGDEWLPMPDGRLYHHSCVHRQDDGKAVVPGSLPPCPYAPRRAPAPVEESGVSYYSDWAVYAQMASKNGFSLMSSTFSVPPAPQSRGPAGLSSVYLFNGLEDGGGHHGAASLILQPVLQYGKSGCVLNPLSWAQWHWVAFLVDGSGRAFCGKILKVEEGEELVGNMTLQSATATQQTWEVRAARPKTGEASTHIVQLDNKVLNAAYVTLEVMICYSCKAYPDTPQTTFSSNVLLDGAGKRIPVGVGPTTWTPMARHTECGQQAVPATDGSGDVSLQYRAAA